MHSIATLILAATALVGCAATPNSLDWEHAPLPPAASLAPESGGAPVAQAQRPPEGAGASRSDGRNFAEVSLGYTFGRGGDGLTIGATYEYLLRKDMGVGGFGQYTAGDNDDVGVLGGGVFFHPQDAWRVLVGLGFEFGDDTEFLARVGGSYEFPLGTMTLSPEAYIDFTTGGDVPLYIGVSFGKKF